MITLALNGCAGEYDYLDEFPNGFTIPPIDFTYHFNPGVIL